MTQNSRSIRGGSVQEFSPARIVAPVLFAVLSAAQAFAAAYAPDNPPNPINGVFYRYFQTNGDSVVPSQNYAPTYFGVRPNCTIGTALDGVGNNPFGDPRNDNWGAEFTGYIEVPATSSYIFYTASDDGTQLFIHNQLIVNNNFFQPITERSGSIELQAGKHEFRMVYGQGAGGFGSNPLQYENFNGLTKQVIPDSAFWYSYRPADFATPATTDPGLNYAYYQVAGPGGVVFNDYSQYSPFQTGIFPNPTIQQGVNPIEPRNDNWTFIFTGYVQVPQDGLYTFFTASDDGSTMSVGNKLVVDNNFSQGVVERNGAIGLKAGLHPVSIVFGEGGGGFALNVLYTGGSSSPGNVPAIAKQDIPNTAYFIARRAPENPAATTASQLNYKKYNGSAVIPGNPPNLDSLTEAASGVLTGASVAPATLTEGPTAAAPGDGGSLLSPLGANVDNQYLNYSGFLEITTGGIYTFTLSSNDGSVLYIGSQLLINNNVDQPLTDRSAPISLGAGKHAMRILFGHGVGGGQALSLRYAGADTGGTAAFIPSARLYTASFPPPSITNVSPLTGPAGGGNSVTITGTNFTPNAVVTFGGSAATNATVSGDGTSITLIAPAMSGINSSAQIKVTNFDGLSTVFGTNYVYQLRTPENPATTIAGLFFTYYSSAIGGGNIPDFSSLTPFSGGIAPNPNIAPGNEPNNPFDPTDPNGWSVQWRGFIEVPQDGVYTFFTDSDDGAKLYIGTTLVVNGDFPQGAGQEEFGTIALAAGRHATTLQFAQGVGGYSMRVSYRGPAGSSIPNEIVIPDAAYSTIPPPTITSLTPPQGAAVGGTSVTITGTGFQTGATVKFDGTLATNYGYAGVPNSITFITPPGIIGPADVIVTNPDLLSGLRTAGFNYIGPPPTFISITPNSGPTSGGSTITVTGTNFTAAMSILIGTNPATNIVVNANGTSATALAPAGTPGQRSVIVRNPDNQQVVATNAFTYVQLQAETPPSPQQGVLYTYWHTNGESIATFSNLVAFPTTGIRPNCTIPFNTNPFEPGFATNWGAQFAGYIQFPRDGEYTLTTISDDGSTLYINDALVVNNNFYQGATPRSGSIFLAAGLHSFRVEWGQGAADYSLAVQWAGPGIVGTVDIPDSAFFYSLRAPDTANSTTPGILAQYYHAAGPAGTLPDFTTESVFASSIFTNANIVPGVNPFENLNDNWSIIYSGYLKITQGGNYAFSTESDDGSRMFIGNQMIVANNYSQGMTERSGSMALAAGLHPMTIQFCEGGGGYGMNVRYAGPDTGGVRALIADSAYVVSLRAPELAAPNADTTQGQLFYKYFISPINVTGVIPGTSPTLDNLSPVSAGLLTANTPNQIGTSICEGPTPGNNFDGGNLIVTRTQNIDFYFKHTGYASITQPGTYTFTTNSDDGSILLIGNTIVVNNNFAQGTTARLGTVGLQAGLHKITILYGQGNGGFSMSAQYRGPDTGNVDLFIPTNVLYTDVAPTIVDFNPKTGITTGGTSVTVTGTGFRPGVKVFLGQMQMTITNQTPTSITFTTPPSPFASYTLEVAYETASAIGAQQFRYLGPVPDITNVVPNTGYTSGNQTITINGVNIATGAIIRVGGVLCTNVVVAVNGLSCTCTTPATATLGAVNVELTNPDGQTDVIANGFTYILRPPDLPGTPGANGLVNGLNYRYYHATAPGGMLMDFTTAGVFLSNPIANVTFNNVNPVEPARVDTFSFQFRGYVNVPVDGYYTIFTASDDGTRLFVGDALVVDNNLSQPTTERSGSIHLAAGLQSFTVQYGQGFGGYEMQPIRITNTAAGLNHVDIDPAFYFVEPPPIVTSVTPSQGGFFGGTPVTIGGSGFVNGPAAVYFNGNPATNVVVQSSTSITCNTPVGALGGTNVVVVNGNLSGITMNGLYTYDNSMRDPDFTNGNGTLPGVFYRYYLAGGNNVPNFNLLTPASSGIRSNHFVLGNTIAPPVTRNDDWSIQFISYVRIPVDGFYTFYTDSDDGAVLYIGGAQVVNGDFGQGQGTPESGLIGLKSGLHFLRVGISEGGGGFGLQRIRYSNDSTIPTATDIPDSDLVYIPSFITPQVLNPNVNEGQPVNVSAAINNNFNNQFATVPTTVAWTVTDPFGNIVGTANGQSVQVIPQDSGNLTVVSSLVFEGGYSIINTAQITVANIPPTATLPQPVSVNEGTNSPLAMANVHDDSSVDQATLRFAFSYGGGPFVCADGVTPTDGTYAGTAANSGSVGTVPPGAIPDGPGSTSVTVRVMDKDGGMNDYSGTLTIDNVAPTVAVTGLATSPEGSDYALVVTAVVDPGQNEGLVLNDVTKSFISWGDGTPNTMFTGVTTYNHTYADNGNYDIKVTLTDVDNPAGYPAVTVKTVNVTIEPPTVGVTGANSTSEGSVYALTLGAPSDPADTITAGTIDWGDGTPVTTLNVATIPGNYTHTFADGQAIRTVNVNLTDEDGTFVAGTLNVTVNNVAPTIAASGNTTIDEGSLYTLTLDAVVDPGTDTVSSYIVNWGDGATDTFTSAGAKTHTYVDGSQAGTLRTITVDLVDEDGTYTAAATKTVTVNNVAPTGTLTNDGPVDEGSSATVTVNNPSDPSSADTDAGLKYSYDFNNDGTFDVGGGDYASAVASPTATIDATLLDDVGLTVRVRIFDKDNAFVDLTTTITVNNVPPTAIFAPSASEINEGGAIQVGFTGQFDPSNADTAAGFRYAYYIVVDDVDTLLAGGATYATGVTETSFAVPAIYLNDGPRSVTLKGVIIDKNDGASIPITTAVFIKNVAPTISLTGAAQVNEGAVYSVTLGAVVDPGADTVTTYRVNWGDTTHDDYTSTGVKTHTYLDGGAIGASKPITVDLIDEDGTFNAAGTLTVKVFNVAPGAGTLTSGGPVNEGTDTTVTAAGFTDVSGDIAAGLHYSYYSVINSIDTLIVGGSSYAAAVPSSSVTVPGNFFADGPGDITIKVVAYDHDGATAEATTSIHINNAPPAANAGPDRGVLPSQIVTINGSFTDPGLADQGNENATFAWHATTTNTDVIPDGAGPTFSFVPTANGTYTVTLTVTDKDGASDTDEAIISVGTIVPTGEVLLTSCNVGVAFNYTVVFQLGPTPAQLFATLLNSGGTINSLAALGLSFNSDTKVLSGTAVKAGVATIELRTADSEVAAYLILTINPPAGSKSNPPQVVSGPTVNPTPSVVGAEVTFTVTISDKDGDLLSLYWDFGDGTSSRSLTPKHTYAVAGIYQCALIVQDGKNTVARQFQVVVIDEASSSFAASSLKLTLDFKKPEKSVLTIGGNLPIPANTPIPGTIAHVEIFGTQYEQDFQFSSKGIAGDALSQFKLKVVKPGPTSTLSKFTFTLKGSTLAQKLAPLGYVNATIVKPGFNINVPFFVKLPSNSTTTLQAVIRTNYTSVSGKAGKAKFVK